MPFKFKTVDEEINYIKRQMNIIMEQHKYEYGCVMLYFDFPEINKIHNIIAPDDLYEEVGEDYGLEKESHLTLLFGLHEEVSTKDIEKVLGEYTFESCKAHNPSLFNLENYDVLKFDVEGGIIHEVNKKLKKFPHTTEHPKYHPHMTIAYLKKGTGKKYCEKLKTKKYWLTPQYAVYSKPDKSKDKITIRVD